MKYVGGDCGTTRFQTQWCVCIAVCRNGNFPDFGNYHCFTPLRNYLPGYMNSEVRAQVVTNALRADSLQQVVTRQNMYIMNIQDIFSGKVKADTVQSIDSLTILRSDSLMERTRQEEEFRKQYEESERYNLTAVDDNNAASGLIFIVLHVA